MKTTVIHHSADYDGIFCREIARKFLPDAELIGWDFKDDPIPVPEGHVYIMDLPADRVFGWNFQAGPAPDPKEWVGLFERMIWIDHHKSSIDSHPTDIKGYRIDGVAACRLAWQWFTTVDGNTTYGNVGNSVRAAGVLPMIQDYKERKVNEPWSVLLAGEYDIWDKRDPNAELFQHGLRSQDLSKEDWKWLLTVLDPNRQGEYDLGMTNVTVMKLLQQGKFLQYAKTKENGSIIKEIGFDLQWEGLTFLCCNAVRYNSHLFLAGLKPEHDACFGFKWTGKDWSVSLYHAPGKEHHDLSKIAVKYGGGGHRGACGFRADDLPFLP